MKIKLVIILNFYFLGLFCQNFDKEIKINQTFIKSSVIYPFSGEIIYGANISGIATLNTDSSLIRIILNDSINNSRVLLFESYTMLDTNKFFNFSGVSDEANYLNNFSPTSIEIQLFYAKVTISNLRYRSYFVQNADSLQRVGKRQSDTKKIDKINNYLEKNKLLWKASKTNLSDMFFNNREKSFGVGYKSYGFEFYSEGIFGVKSEMDNYVKSSSNLVEYFDWRTKHDANMSNSLYYDNNGCGWVTPPRCQSGCWLNNEWQCYSETDCLNSGGEYRSTGTCVAFGTVAAVESYVNLFYNQHIDYDLSEQNMISPCGNVGINGASPTAALTKIRDNYILTEDCFPFEGVPLPCANSCTNPSETISINNYSSVPRNEDLIKLALINNGPLVIAGIYSPYAGTNHETSLIGYDIIKLNDNLWGDYIAENSTYLGMPYWILKDSDNSFKYLFFTSLPSYIYKITGDISSLLYSSNNINCNDLDNDGYFNWGIGLKPSTCPLNSPNEEDGNDNDQSRGPLDIHASSWIINDNTSSFENSFDGWIQSQADDFDWYRNTGETETENTGPSSAQDGNYYIYADASVEDPFVNQTTIIESPLIYFNKCSYELSFWFHKYNSAGWGHQGSRLELQISYDGGINWIDDYWYVDETFSNPNWNEVKLYLSGNVNKIRFIANKGVSAYNDIALDNISFSANQDIIISSNQTWNTVHQIPNNIIINSGYTLTVNSEVIMNKGSKIIVQPNGKLRIINGTITNNCDEMWYGIEVQGDPTKSQYDSQNNKGLVYLSGATIENANYAITSFNGGIIQATGANFYNNYLSVKLDAWTNPGTYSLLNKTYFTNCNFEINKAELNNGHNWMNSFIYAYNNGGNLKLNGNTFKNTNQNWSSGNLGKAIYLNSSTAEVNYRCKIITQYGEECPVNERDYTEFNNLSFGVYSTASTASAVKINECIFNNNVRDISILGATNTATITKNTFNAGSPFTNYVSLYSVYFYNSTNYTVEENIFNGNSVSDVGVYVNRSGSAANEIYKNSFNAYTRQANSSATVAYNKNSNFVYGSSIYVGQEGLQFHCNNYTNYNYAMAIVDGNMRKDQGNNSTTTTELAGNTFDHNSSIPESDFFVDGTIVSSLKIPQYNYYQHNTAIAKILSYSSNVTPYTIPIPYDENACPSHISTGGGGFVGGFSMLATKATVETLDAQISTEENDLKTLVDNGNTGILLSQTETATNNTFAELSNKIKQSKGYISDQVATEYLNSNVEQDFVKANTLVKISPLPEKAKAELENSNINETLKYIVLQNQNGKNIREQKELAIANKKHSRQMLIRNAIQEALLDTINEKTDSVIEFLKTRNELANRYTLVSLIIKQNKLNEARNELSNLSSTKYQYNNDDQDEIDNFVNLQNIIMQIKENNDTMYKVIVEQNLNFLNNLAADSNSVLQTTAWNLLENAEIANFTEKVILPQPNTNKTAKIERIKPFFGKHNGLEPLINIYPNPAKDYITVEYAMLDKGDAVTIGIYDMQGKLIKQVNSDNQIDVLKIDISDLQAGYYNVQFVSALQGNYTVKINKQ